MKRIRVVFCGEASVGKSSIIERFAHKKFDEGISSTIAGAFHLQFVKMNGEVINLEVWDTAGSERYHSVIPSFFKSAAVVVICYDVSKRESFTALDFWKQFVSVNSPLNTPMILVGNKIDLEEQRKVPYEEGKRYCDSNEFIGFFESSAKTGEGIDHIFSLFSTADPSGTADETDISEVIELDHKCKC